MIGKNATIGVDKLHYAEVTLDEETKEVTANGTPKKIPDVNKINITVKTNRTEAYADDITEIDDDIESIDIAIDTIGISNTILAELDGHTFDSNGVMVHNRDDKAKHIAIGFRSKKKNKAYRYVWLLLGKKAPSNEEYETQKGKEGKKTQLTFTFVHRTDGNIKYQVDSDNEKAPEDLDSKWFAKVYDGTWA